MKELFEKDTWQEIFGSISKNRVRTVITMIGVLWGIFIFITLSGTAKGLDNGFERAFASISSNSIRFHIVIFIPYYILHLQYTRYLRFELCKLTYIRFL